MAILISPLKAFTSPKTSHNISAVIAPGLRIVGVSVVRSRTVDSMPKEQSPPSSIYLIFPFKSLYTCCAVVGETCFETLAEGAASGAESSISLLAILCSGILTATVPPPAVTASGTSLLFFKTSVRGPGINFSANKYA